MQFHWFHCVAFLERSILFRHSLYAQITSLRIVYSTFCSRRRSKKTPKLCFTGLCTGNSPVTGNFDAYHIFNWKTFIFIVIWLAFTTPMPWPCQNIHLILYLCQWVRCIKHSVVLSWCIMGGNITCESELKWNPIKVLTDLLVLRFVYLLWKTLLVKSPVRSCTLIEINWIQI